MLVKPSKILWESRALMPLGLPIRAIDLTPSMLNLDNMLVQVLPAQAALATPVGLLCIEVADRRSGSKCRAWFALQILKLDVRVHWQDSFRRGLECRRGRVVDRPRLDIQRPQAIGSRSRTRA